MTTTDTLFLSYPPYSGFCLAMYTPLNLHTPGATHPHNPVPISHLDWEPSQEWSIWNNVEGEKLKWVEKDITLCPLLSVGHCLSPSLDPTYRWGLQHSSSLHCVCVEPMSLLRLDIQNPLVVDLGACGNESLINCWKVQINTAWEVAWSELHFTLSQDQIISPNKIVCL